MGMAAAAGDTFVVVAAVVVAADADVVVADADVVVAEADVVGLAVGVQGVPWVPAGQQEGQFPLEFE